ncbi:hypothetical protein [Marinomonas mediterranea]|uniref:hypothetical protein n=1 Tax=Marinomonas mediterranea TaxID=119864 RepID=UPI00234B7441|nr:hypothetical protein [Marinomonas mediterranea]WCN09107.1 hypothetical protein GV055_09290 [Marinomonas mediterranea]
MYDQIKIRKQGNLKPDLTVKKRNKRQLKARGIIKSLQAQKTDSLRKSNPCVFQRWYDDELLPVLAEGTPDYDLNMIARNQNNVAAVSDFVDGLNRTDFDFWADTKRVLFNETPHHAFNVPIGPNGDQVRQEWHWYVEDDNQYMILDAIDIGHIVDWRDYLKECGVTNIEEARTAFNDLRNLKLQSSGANRGHAWELDENGDWVE